MFKMECQPNVGTGERSRWRLEPTGRSWRPLSAQHHNGTGDGRRTSAPSGKQKKPLMNRGILYEPWLRTILTARLWRTQRRTLHHQDTCFLSNSWIIKTLRCIVMAVLPERLRYIASFEGCSGISDGQKYSKFWLSGWLYRWFFSSVILLRVAVWCIPTFRRNLPSLSFTMKTKTAV